MKAKPLGDKFKDGLDRMNRIGRMEARIISIEILSSQSCSSCPNFFLL
jgi:hypothetical protein